MFKGFKQSKESKVGLYTTVIFHLVIVIILLISSIGVTMQKESSFVLDFSKQEQIEKEKEIVEFKEKVSKELDQMIAQSRNQRVRNVAVDAGEKLKDDRSKNPSQVYNEARRLQNSLDAARQRSMALDKEDADHYASLNKSREEEQSSNTKAYSGPSVISYTLDGRKAQYLPVPAYKGYGSGDVAVKIYVNMKGRVVDAEVIESLSTSDSSLWDFAIAAAKRSRFTASTTAPATQIGEIVYRFIAQ